MDIDAMDIDTLLALVEAWCPDWEEHYGSLRQAGHAMKRAQGAPKGGQSDWETGDRRR